MFYKLEKITETKFYYTGDCRSESKQMSPCETKLPPLPTGFQEICIIDFGVQKIDKDYRGRKAYLKSDPAKSITVSEVGELDENYTFTKSNYPAYQHMINGVYVFNEEKKPDLINAVSSKLDAEKEAVLTEGIDLGGGYMLPVTDETQINLLGVRGDMAAITFPKKIGPGKAIATAMEMTALIDAVYAFKDQVFSANITAKEELYTKTMEELIELL